MRSRLKSQHPEPLVGVVGSAGLRVRPRTVTDSLSGVEAVRVVTTDRVPRLLSGTDHGSDSVPGLPAPRNSYSPGRRHVRTDSIPCRAFSPKYPRPTLRRRRGQPFFNVPFDKQEYEGTVDQAFPAILSEDPRFLGNNRRQRESDQSIRRFDMLPI